MCRSSAFSVAFILTSFVGGVLGLNDPGLDLPGITPNVSCEQIASSVSSDSAVYWPDSAEYSRDIAHWSNSSSDSSICSVEPGNVDDIGIILQILKSNETPFAVKGGGHSTNPGFSSTPGVQIAMYRFSEVNYNETSQTVDIGAGLTWDEVYAALEPFGVNVVGGRVPGVGVAGLTLGGGYSYLSNERGLTIDNVLAFDLVLPGGTFMTVTNDSNPDLFWALKGGSNNFGIVTKFTMKAFTQGQIWGGSIVIAGDHYDEVNAALAKYTSTVQDPKAALVTNYLFLSGSLFTTTICFYNDPNPPAGIFDDFLAIPSVQQDISTRSFLSLILSTNFPVSNRGLIDTVSVVDYSTDFLSAITNETQFWSNQTSYDPSVSLVYIAEPFLSSAFSQGANDSSSYPPTRTLLFPTSIYWGWSLNTSDSEMFESIKQSAQQLTNVAEGEGQDLSALSLYGNYAVYGTPLEKIYGGNLERLRTIKSRYDPENVMGLAGGWKF